jgi:hypothetical protein
MAPHWSAGTFAASVTSLKLDVKVRMDSVGPSLYFGQLGLWA